MFLSGTGSGQLRRMAVLSFLPRTLARARFESFCLGCPAADRRTYQESNGYGLANLPSEFVEEKHALERHVRQGPQAGPACDGKWQNCAASMLRRSLQAVRVDPH